MLSRAIGSDEQGRDWWNGTSAMADIVRRSSKPNHARTLVGPSACIALRRRSMSDVVDRTSLSNQRLAAWRAP